MNKLPGILKRRIRLFLFISILGINFTGCSKKIYSHLKWQTVTSATDGKPDEWTIPLKFYDSESKLNYDISNDKKNLYVIFKISDEFTKAKVIRAGIQFAIDVTGKKNFPVTVNYQYPVDSKLSEIPSPGADRDNFQDNNEVREKLAVSQILLRLSGFNKDVKELLPLKNEYGIDAAFDIDNNDILYYELKIPFNTFYKEEITAADTLSPFNFEITLLPLIQKEINAALADDGSSQNQPGGGGVGNMPGGTSGTMPGSGNMPGGNMPKHSSQNEDERLNKHTVTQKLKLSLK